MDQTNHSKRIIVVRNVTFTTRINGCTFFKLILFYIFQWVNGQFVKNHEIGHLPFETEITDYVKYGENNRVTVACDNTLLPDTVPQGSISELNS